MRVYYTVAFHQPAGGSHWWSTGGPAASALHSKLNEEEANVAKPFNLPTLLGPHLFMFYIDLTNKNILTWPVMKCPTVRCSGRLSISTPHPANTSSRSEQPTNTRSLHQPGHDFHIKWCWSDDAWHAEKNYTHSLSRAGKTTRLCSRVAFYFYASTLKIQVYLYLRPDNWILLKQWTRETLRTWGYSPICCFCEYDHECCLSVCQTLMHQKCA